MTQQEPRIHAATLPLFATHAIRPETRSGAWRDSDSRFISRNLLRCNLARIVEEELIAVEIVDHQKSIAP